MSRSTKPVSPIGDRMARQGSDSMEGTLTPPGIPRWRLWAANSIFIVAPMLGALPIAIHGIGDGILVMCLTYFSIVIFVVGLRGFATILLGVTNEHDEAPSWMSRPQAALVVTIYLVLLLAAVAPLRMLDISNRILTVIVYAIAGSLWLLMRYAGRRLLAGSKRDCQGRTYLEHGSIGNQEPSIERSK